MTKKIYVSGGSRYAEAKWFGQFGWSQSYNLHEADVVLFTGGEDVNPTYYNEPEHAKTWPNGNGRDEREILDYQKALALGKPMFGICRGAQFLCVMDGGSLIQDCTQHTRSHDILIIDTGEVFSVTSAHHQMMVPSERAEIVGVSPMKCEVTRYNHVRKEFETKEVQNTPEIVLFPDIRAIGVQGHPEFQTEVPEYARFREWCAAALEALYTHASPEVITCD